MEADLSPRRVSTEPLGGTPRGTTGGHPLHGARRLARVGVLGGASLLLASVAHLAGGGALPSPGLLLVMSILVGVTSVTVTARRCRFWSFAAVLAVEQVILHVVFAAASMVSITGGHFGGRSGGHALGMVGMLNPHAAPGAGAPTPVMVVAHLAATLATAWLLARGERWLWRLCDRLIRAARATATPRVRRTRLPRPLPAPALIATRRRTVDAPRGPPAPAAA